MSENGVSNQSIPTPSTPSTPSRDELKARLRSRLYHTQESRKCSFSHESDLRKKKVQEEMIQPKLNCLLYTNNVLPYPVEVLKKFKDKGFAAKIDREEIQTGVNFFGEEFKDHIEFVIEVLKEFKND